MHITPVKFYVSYYPKFNALAIQCVTAVPHYHCITLPYESVLHYHFTLLKCIQFIALDVDGLSIAILKLLISPYSNEKRLHGTLYHNHIKPPKIAFKRVINYVRFIVLIKRPLVSYLLPVCFIWYYMPFLLSL